MMRTIDDKKKINNGILQKKMYYFCCIQMKFKESTILGFCEDSENF